MTGTASELTLAGMIFTNANQVISLGTASANYAALPTSATQLTVPSSINDLAVDLLGYYAFDSVPGTNQTLRLAAINSGYASIQVSTKAGNTGATTMSWSMSGTTEISQLGIAVKSR